MEKNNKFCIISCTNKQFIIYIYIFEKNFFFKFSISFCKYDKIMCKIVCQSFKQYG